jgi:CheY-like chemotaxis protein
MDSTLHPHPLIIAVDDEADDLFFVRHLIGKTGMSHRFQSFTNGDAAIIGLTALIEQNDGLAFPLVCFLDIKMPGINGFDLLKWIRGQKALDIMPTIMFSSSDDPRDIDQAREVGAQGYLKKYPTKEAMRTTLEEAREFSLLPPPKKIFLHWSYRFIDTGPGVSAGASAGVTTGASAGAAVVAK